ncbi:unnamed protein product [Dibothriocephalus latus]|uniref:Uncharacterized protein n=1 Tax=Dibothriocephalus latus TaxID=60516 RepID=A0A3P7NZC8_DIBLA|nr:unnamed protein product [Dibothriocephalus latus]
MFYLELERTERQIAQQKQRLHQFLTDLRTQKPDSKSTLKNLTTCIQETLAEMVQFYIDWQKVELKCQLVAPLHRRMPLRPGEHSGVLLNSISLPNGEQLKSGRHVLVHANKPSDLLHREWVVEDQESRVMSTVPAPFVWLSSTDVTPVQSPANSRRSTPINCDTTNPNNRMAPVSSNETTTPQVDTVLEKLDAFVENCKEEEPNERLELESGLTSLKDKISQSKDENQTAAMDQNHVSALTDALDAYEGFIGCFHKYQTGFSPQPSPDMDNDFRTTPS